MATGLNLTDLIEADLRAYLVTQSSTAQKQDANLAEIEKSYAQEAKMYDEIGTLNAVVQGTRAAQKLQEQNANLEAARKLGVDPEAGVNIINDRLAKLEASNVESEAALTEYQRLENLDFFDNPVEYIKAGLFGKDAALEKLQQTAAKTALYSQQVQTSHNLLQETFQTNAAMRTGMNVASVEAITRATKLASDIEALKASREALRWNSERANMWLNADAKRLDLLFSAAGNNRAEQQLGLAYESAQRQREEAARAARAEGRAVELWSYQRQALIDEQTARDANVTLLRAQTAKINNITGVLGLPNLSEAEVKQGLERPNTPLGQQIYKLYEMSSRIGGSNQGLIAATPSGAVEVLSEINARLNPVAEKTKGILAEAMRALDKEAKKNLSLDPSNKANGPARAAWVDNYVNSRVAQDAGNIRPNSGNLFDVGDIGTYFNSPSIGGLPLVQKVLGPKSQAGVALSDPKIVVSLTLDALKKKEITSAEATQLSQIYQRAYGMRTSQLLLQELGIKVPAPAYNVTMRTATDFTGNSLPFKALAGATDLAKKGGLPFAFGAQIMTTGIDPFLNEEVTVNIADTQQWQRYMAGQIGAELALKIGSPK